MYDRLSDCLSSLKLKFLPFYPLHNISSIRIGPNAAICVFPSSAEEFVATLNLLYRVSVKFCVVGALTNTLFLGDVYDGVVVCTKDMRAARLSGDRLFAECGISLSAAILYAARRGYGGAEQLSLIPGTVGAAIRGNAGAHGMEISDILIGAWVYNVRDGSVRYLPKEDLCLVYRGSLIKSSAELYVLGAELLLSPTAIVEAFSRRKEFAAMRSLSQPIDKPSLGSVFKRAGGRSAGYYIERVGLKGYGCGGARISEKHAGFIVNHGGATADDVLDLISIAEARVFDRFGITLEREIVVLK